MDQFADAVKGGSNIALPGRVGAFVISKTEIGPGEIVCLWTDTNPSGPSGFVRCSPEHARDSFALWAYVSLNDEWQLVFLD